jgi:hypothetical protein
MAPLEGADDDPNLTCRSTLSDKDRALKLIAGITQS